MTDMISKIDELLNAPCYLIDIFPCTVPRKADGRYFVVEEYFQDHRKTLDEKFLRLLLKLYCYYDFQICFGEEYIAAPNPEQVIKSLQSCFEKKLEMKLYLPHSDSLISMDGDVLYLTLCNPDQKLKEFVSELAHAEGLFFYPAP